jgi:hypothetical protein
VQVLFTADDPAAVRQTIAGLIAAGFGRIVLAVRPPWLTSLPRWLAGEIICPPPQAGP